MSYEITAYEFKEGTEEADTYIVLVKGKKESECPIFGTYAEAEEWMSRQVEF